MLQCKRKDSSVKFERDTVVDRALFRFAPTAQNRQRKAELLALDALDESSVGCDHIHSRSRRRQALRLINHARIAALKRDALTEFFFRLAVLDQFVRQIASLIDRLRALA